jgi:sigma-54 dependent transcriptional regulator, acetoin dehydrogenase operon transcriptional activator AcoR
MFSDSRLEEMKAAWEQFVGDGRLPEEHLIRQEVMQSWIRSKEMGLDPHAPKLAIKIPVRMLSVLRDECRNFLETALPFMEFLKNAVKGTEFILVLTNRSAVVLELFGDEAILKKAHENNYVPGCSRAEEDVGTNAICLANLEQKPIQLTGAEHWNSRHHNWSCASAPVFFPEGVFIGCVTLSGESTHAHRHTLGMVISAAEAISERMREREARRQCSHADVMLSSVLTSISDAIVTVDYAGIVTNMNPAASKMLGVSSSETIGKNMVELFPENPELINVLNPNKDVTTLEVSPKGSRGRANFVITRSIMQNNNAVQGAILTIRERREFLDTVRNVSGFNAVFTFDDIIGTSPVLMAQVELSRVTASKSSRILITGETGTGKELFAQAIHNCSPRRKGPFVALNCAAIPRELLESELFGYKGGAFTGASKSGQIGKLELADGGTIFLDEINQMPVDLQSKLLRVLQEGFITRVGDSKPMRVDLRVIAATNEDLYAKSRDGSFRQDLYFRLSVVEVNLPPLRERVEDIPLLAGYLLKKLATKLNEREIVLSKEAADYLCRYPWPGNIRELENVLEMAVIICDGTAVEPCHLSQRVKAAYGALSDTKPTALSPNVAPVVAMYHTDRVTHPLRDVEIDVIRSKMQELRGNVAEVARMLGISRSTIYRRMKEHDITKSVNIY